MSSAVQNILANIVGDGARSAKYEVQFEFTNPKAGSGKDTLLYLGRTSSFPGKSYTTVDIKYKGRNIPVRGQVKYQQSWECTFTLTEDHALKQEFENWIEALDEQHNYYDPSLTKSVRATQKVHNETAYTTTAFIHQRNFSDSANTAKYTLFNVFPVDVSPVQVNYESLGEILTFTVQFSYSHYTLDTVVAPGGNFVDNLAGKAYDGAASGAASVGKIAADTAGAAGAAISNALGLFGAGGSGGSGSAKKTSPAGRVHAMEAQRMGADVSGTVSTDVAVLLKGG